MRIELGVSSRLSSVCLSACPYPDELEQAKDEHAKLERANHELRLHAQGLELKLKEQNDAAEEQLNQFKLEYKKLHDDVSAEEQARGTGMNIYIVGSLHSKQHQRLGAIDSAKQEESANKDEQKHQVTDSPHSLRTSKPVNASLIPGRWN